MTGFRKSIPPGGCPRSAWAHPQDLVRVIQEELVTCTSDKVVLDYLVRVAWLHDILEDGWKSEGVRVTEEDLWESDVDSQVIQDVVAISRKQGEEKNAYLARLIYAPMRVRLLKCIDRTCNLREAPKKDAAWWDMYSDSTRRYILPLARSLSSSEGWDIWANSILEHALTLRPSRRMNQIVF